MGSRWLACCAQSRLLLFPAPISESPTKKPQARRPRKGLPRRLGRRISRRRRSPEASAAGSVREGLQADSPCLAGKPTDFWTRDSGARRSGTEEGGFPRRKLPGDLGRKKKELCRHTDADWARSRPKDAGCPATWDGWRRDSEGHGPATWGLPGGLRRSSADIPEGSSNLGLPVRSALRCLGAARGERWRGSPWGWDGYGSEGTAVLSRKSRRLLGWGWGAEAERIESGGRHVQVVPV